MLRLTEDFLFSNDGLDGLRERKRSLTSWPVRADSTFLARTNFFLGDFFGGCPQPNLLLRILAYCTTPSPFKRITLQSMARR
jgi:hypothetical protein